MSHYGAGEHPETDDHYYPGRTKRKDEPEHTNEPRKEKLPLLAYTNLDIANSPPQARQNLRLGPLQIALGFNSDNRSSSIDADGRAVEVLELLLCLGVDEGAEEELIARLRLRLRGSVSFGCCCAGAGGR